MERVIKFRCWYSNKMYGNEEAIRILYNNAAETKLLHREDVIIMQFTGLTDKNGKEIWSKDIAKDELGNLYLVEYSGFEIFPFFSGSPYRSTLLPNQIEIIGNVHEHPHLIK